MAEPRGNRALAARLGEMLRRQRQNLAMLRRATGVSLDELVDDALGDPAEPPEQATDVMYLLRDLRRMSPRQVALLRRIARAITDSKEA